MNHSSRLIDPISFNFEEAILGASGVFFSSGGKILELVSKGILRANPVTYYTYELKDLTIHDVYLTTSDNSIFCHGTSLDISEAYAKAFGEVFERTSIRYNVDEGMLEVSERELREQGIPRVSLEHFPKPTELQKRRFDYMVFNEDTKFSWGTVVSMHDGKEYRIPAQTIFLSNFRTYPDEKMITESSSHGAGAGYTKTQAITSGIHEIINRHFFLKSWYEGGIPKRILIDSLPEGSVVLHLAKNLEQRGFTIHLLDYSHEAGIPSVICILERYGGWSCGGTAGTSLEGAIQRSLLEAISTYLWYVEKMVKEGNTIHQKDISQVKSGFIDVEYGAAVPKVLLYNHEYYVQSTVYSKTMITGDFIPFSKECDTSVTYDARSHACKLFGDALYYQAHKEYLDEYDFFSVKVIIPNSYYFCLDEKDSRPVLNDTYPQNTEMNPFP
jgi:thiazole/oxazole-forming peptide maturase SagD family component